MTTMMMTFDDDEVDDDDGDEHDNNDGGEYDNEQDCITCGEQ